MFYTHGRMVKLYPKKGQNKTKIKALIRANTNCKNKAKMKDLIGISMKYIDLYIKPIQILLIFPIVPF